MANSAITEFAPFSNGIYSERKAVVAFQTHFLFREDLFSESIMQENKAEVSKVDALVNKYQIPVRLSILYNKLVVQALRRKLFSFHARFHTPFCLKCSMHISRVSQFM